MHLYRAGSESTPEVVELDVRVVSEQGHGDRGVREPLGNHQGGKTLAKGIVMGPGLPDGNLFRLPGFDRAHRDGPAGDHGNVASA